MQMVRHCPGLCGIDEAGDQATGLPLHGWNKAEVGGGERDWDALERLTPAPETTGPDRRTEKACRVRE